jgi:membrane fusion protein (multidrug efflux system)
MNSNALADPAELVVPTLKPVNPSVAVKIRRALPWKGILGGLAIVAVVGSGVGTYLYHVAGFETTDNAFLEGNIHPVSARINGTVLRVLVDDNAHVEAGQPLAEIDPVDLTLAMQATEADLAQAHANATQVAAQIARAEADVKAADARVAQNAAQLRRLELDFHRAEALRRDQNGVISQQAFDAARADFDAAQANQTSLIATHVSAEATLAAARAQDTVALAQIQKAETTRRLAKLQVDYTVIRAPSAGRVAKKTVEVGQRLQTGQSLMAVVSDRVWVVANFKENQLRKLHAGEIVDVEVDAIKGRTFHGTIESFSPGTGAKFALLAPDNATGNFTKIVQRMPVKIILDEMSTADSAEQLVPGLSALVKVSVREPNAEKSSHANLAAIR